MYSHLKKDQEGKNEESKKRRNEKRGEAIAEDVQKGEAIVNLHRTNNWDSGEIF